MGKTTLLVDGNAVSYVVNVNSCKDEKEYAKQFIDFIRNYGRQYNSFCDIILFFDNKNGTWRDEIYPDYQKTRKTIRDNYTPIQKSEMEKRSYYINYLKEQIDKTKTYSYVSYPHTETDDLVSLYCKNIQEQDETVIILTTDKDLYQLISENKNKKVSVMSIVNHELIKSEEEGKSVLEQKILLGDSSDNIPSVCKGVGKKYLSDFKVFLTKTKQNNVDTSNKEECKKLCDLLGIKYINSFSNFNIEQLRLNKQLIDLNTVCERDKNEGYPRTKYLKDNISKFKISPFALYKIKLN